jgi:hypothetical protein
LFDAKARFLSILSDIVVDTGGTHIIYDIHFLKSGIYYLKMDAGKRSQTKKLVTVFSK